MLYSGKRREVTKTYRFIIAIVLVSVHGPVGALSFPDIAFSGRALGADLALSIPLVPSPDSGPGLVFHLGGGVESAWSYWIDDPPRYHADLVPAGSTAEYLNRNLELGMGVTAPLVFRAHELITTAIIRYRREAYEYPGPESILASALGSFDAEGLDEIAIHAGVAVSRRNPLRVPLTRIPLSYRFEAGVYVAPDFGLDSAPSYLRGNMNARMALQLINRIDLSLYLSARVGIDLLAGNSIPLHAFGAVRELRGPFYSETTALGGIVRGLDPSRFGGANKGYARNELRLKVMTPIDVNPILTAFVDAGVSGYEPVSGVAGFSGQLTTGVGVSVDILGVTSIGYFVAFCPFEPDPDRRIGHGLILGWEEISC